MICFAVHNLLITACHIEIFTLKLNCFRLLLLCIYDSHLCCTRQTLSRNRQCRCHQKYYNLFHSLFHFFSFLHPSFCIHYKDPNQPVCILQGRLSKFKSLLNTVIMQEFSFCRKCFDLLFRRKHISIRLFCLKFQIFI